MKVALVGTARDTELYLPHLLLIVDEIRNRCLTEWPHHQFITVFFENDSSDDTYILLNSWCSQRNDAVLISETMLTQKIEKRTHRLAHARNKVLTYLRQNHSDCDRVAVMDMDDVCVDLNVDDFMAVLTSDFDGVSLKCATSQPRHSDGFALRGLATPNSACVTTSMSMPDWRVCNSLDQHGIDERFLDALKTNFKRGEPVQVKSCFNHLGIYNGHALLKTGRDCVYSGDLHGMEECEHVPLNTCLLPHGTIQVEPSFSVCGLGKDRCQTAHLRYADLARPISSRRLPHIPQIFSWSDDYLKRDTEDIVPPGYFLTNWNPHASWVWVRAGTSQYENDICQFARDIVRILRNPIVLLTGDGDRSVPAELSSDIVHVILDSPYVTCWITQNCSAPGAYGGKIQAMPIGLDDKLSNERITCAPSFRPMTGKVVIDAHLVRAGYSETAKKRQPNQLSCQAVHESIKDLPHVTAPTRRIPRDALHELWKSADYIVCCEGNGMDTHRAWEVLCLNRIPIVYKTPMTESLYRGLPVILTEDMLKTVSDHAMLTATARTFMSSSSLNLTASFWLGRAAGKGAQPLWFYHETVRLQPFHVTKSLTASFAIIIISIISFVFMMWFARNRIHKR